MILEFRQHNFPIDINKNQSLFIIKGKSNYNIKLMNIAKLLGSFFSPANITAVGCSLAIYNELRKHRQNSDETYNILKEDVVNVYQQKIDESSKDPLVSLLNERQDQLDPELKKRLQLYAEWQKNDNWTVAKKMGPIVLPIVIGSVVAFPRVMAWTSLVFGFTSDYNYSIENQIITGDKVKSVYVKGMLPKQETIQQYFTFLGCGILALAMLRVFGSKYNNKIRDQIVEQWKKNKQKK